MRAITAAVLTTAILRGGPPLAAQGAGNGPPRDASVASIVLGWGSATSEWFSGLYDSDGFNRYDANLGGGVVALKILRGVAPRFRIGGEIGILTMLHGGSGSSPSMRRSAPQCRTCLASTRVAPAVRAAGVNAPHPSALTTTTYYVVGGSDPDDAGIQMNALASLRIASRGRVTWRVEGGGGFMYWNLNEAGRAYEQNMAWQSNTGRKYYESKPGFEPMIVARLVPTIAWGGNGPTGAAFALDPYAAYVATFGTTATTAINFGLGVGLQLGRSR